MRAVVDYEETDRRLALALFERLSTRIAVEVGAERGGFIRALLQSGAEKVIAVEPHPGNAAAIRESFAEHPAVEVLELALGARDENADLYIVEDKSGRRRDAYHSLEAFDETPLIRRVGAVPITCRTLDSLVTEGTIPAEIGALTIDAERSDFSIVQGIGRLFAAVVMLEYWDDLPETVGPAAYRVTDVTRWMRQRGYSNFAVVRRSGEFESVQVNDAQTSPGDWGKIVFIHDRLAPQLMEVVFDAAASAQRKLIEQAKDLACECRLRMSVIERQHERIEDLQRAPTSPQLDSNGVTSEMPATLVDVLQRQSQILERLESRLDSSALPYRDAGQKDDPHQLVPGELLTRLASLERQRAEAEAAAAARLTVIHELQRTLEHHRVWWWGERLRRSWTPKLGVLYQYPPRHLAIPTSYMRPRHLASHGPTVSIVTPSLNQGAFIERTIRSVLDQNYAGLEYIIQDANSTDDTQAILQKYSASLAHVDSRHDDGFAYAINMGFAHATGEILAYLNSDDIVLPGTVQYVATYFAQHPEVDVVYGHRVVIDEYDAEIGRWVLPPHEDQSLSWADYIPQETLFWRRRIWDKVGSAIDESFRFAIDWDLLLRFRDAGARMHRLPRFLGAFRVHPHQKTNSNMQEIGVHEMNQLRTRCHGRRVYGDEIAGALAGYLRKHIVYHKLYRLGMLRY